MKFVELFALQRERKKILETLQQMSVMDIQTAACDEETSLCPQGFETQAKQKEIASFERSMAVAKQSLEILEEIASTKKSMLDSLSGRREIKISDFSDAANRSLEIIKHSYEITNKEKRLSQLKAQKVQINSTLAQLEPWKNLDVPLSFSGTTKTAAFVGSLPYEYGYEQLEELLKDKISFDFSFELIGNAKSMSCIFIVCMKENQKALTKALRELGFSRPPLISHKTPKDKCKELIKRLEDYQNQEQECINFIIEYAKYKDDIEACYDYYKTRAEKYRAIEMLAQSKNTFMIRGYVPENCIEAFCKILEERFCVSITVNDANEDLQPVLLKNNSFVEPVENLTTMYSLPSKRDIDPSAIMSIFYYVFFGMMLSDAGYGLLMILGSMFLIKKYKPEPRMKKNLKLFIYCGISTVFWGLMFGSFFGDSIATLSELFTGTKIIQKPLLFDPMQEATNLLILSLAFGLIQMICGLSVSFYMLWREKKKADAICDVGLWITALLGIACVAVGMVVPVMMMPGAIVAIVSAAGILFTAGRKKKGPMKVLAGLKELYGSTNYVSDFMSYSRLMALGLTTGAMGSVFNMLSAMMGSGLLAIVPLIIIFVVGHGVNFALNALGAYVHTIRLQYVELFSKFYEGGGREYKPFSIEGKFTRISKKK